MKLTVNSLIVNNHKILVNTKEEDPFKGKLALPHGELKNNETLKEAAERIAIEKTGIEIKPVAMLGVYDALDRDPNERNIGVVFICNPINEIKNLKEGYKFINKEEMNKNEFAFDQKKMLESYFAIISLSKN
jgi:ADP-ribose pyrophosphatase YjhB (NUDIX family)